MLILQKKEIDFINNKDEYIYVDYENVQDIKVEFIKNTSKVIILIGNEQIKIPIDLVPIQPMEIRRMD